MKNSIAYSSIFSLLLFVFCVASCESQAPDWYGASSVVVPRSVGDSLCAQYPDAEYIEWVQDDDYYVAHFRAEGFETEAWYTVNAAWRLTVADISYKVSPDPVKQIVDEDFERKGTGIKFVRRPYFSDMYHLDDEDRCVVCLPTGFRLSDEAVHETESMEPVEVSDGLIVALCELYPLMQLVGVEHESGMWKVKLMSEEELLYYLELTDDSYEVILNERLEAQHLD